MQERRVNNILEKVFTGTCIIMMLVVPSGHSAHGTKVQML